MRTFKTAIAIVIALGSAILLTPTDLKAKVTEALLRAHKDAGAESHFKATGYPNFAATAIKDFQTLVTMLQ